MIRASIVETAPLVLDVGVVLLLAGAFGLIARRFGLPAVIGYLLAGIVVSPFTPGFVASNDQLALFADIGVILLLFEVGIEIDIKRISREQVGILFGAPIQVLITLALGTPIFLALGLPILGALLLALSIAMSSSVVIVNITRSKRRTTNTETEEALIGFSVVQDIVGVGIAALILTIYGSSDRSIAVSILGLIGFVALAFIASKLIPLILRILRWESDLFLIFSVAIGLTIAAIGTRAFGIPMALAGFVAGITINQTRDTDEVRKAILPFRDLFAVLFFVVIGSLLEPSQIINNLPFFGLLMLLLVLLKTIPAIAVAKYGKLKANRLQFGIGISQVGEFSFVLGSAALVAGAITKSQFAALLLTVTVSIILSTVLVRQIKRH